MSIVSRMDLSALGWDAFWESEGRDCKASGLVCGRLIRKTKIDLTVVLEGGKQISAVLAGRLWHEAKSDAELPAVGDWVGVDVGEDRGEENVIRRRLKRRTCFSRKIPGKAADEQVLATNVDAVLVVTDLVVDFNLRRLERYLTLIARSGAQGVILLNKADLVSKEEADLAKREIDELGMDVTVHVMSAVSGQGTARLQHYLGKGKTVVVVGSSGVGKSTILNQLLGGGNVWTAEVNAVTGKGRHTTSWRELVFLPGGGMVIDSPGIREVQMWTNEETLRESFRDVEELTAACRFSDCKHRGDAGCAIEEGMRNGKLTLERFESFLQLEGEIAELNRRQKKRQMAVECWAKRSNRVRARNLADRIEFEKEDRGEL